MRVGAPTVRPGSFKIPSRKHMNNNTNRSASPQRVKDRAPETFTAVVPGCHISSSHSNFMGEGLKTPSAWR